MQIQYILTVTLSSKNVSNTSSHRLTRMRKR